MINSYFVILAAFINVVGGQTYFIDTLKGRVKPNKVTWLLWAIAPFIVFAAEIKQGVGIQSLMTFMVGFNPLIIFLASFVNKKSHWQITRFDVICGMLSVCGLLLWFLTKTANIAILFSIAADLLAGIPTVVKSYRNPETEDYRIFLFGAISAAITLLTIQNWNIANYAFPLYIFLFCVPMVVLIKR